jgi:hypothetical protein
MTILVDHNIEGQATRLWDTLVATEWAELLSIKMLMFADVGLNVESSDRVIWRFAQARQLFLLTDNRNMKGEDSLEETIREENIATSLPVLTIGSVDRVINERDYCEQCAIRIAEIIIDRLFIP